MIKSGIDQDALITMFSEASAKQGDALRKSVADATLKALQGRELTLANIRSVLKSVTDATSAGAAKNAAPAVDVEGMLGQAFDGMDNALRQAVEANRKALEQFVAQGADLKDKQLKSALANIEKMEEMFFATVTKAVQGVGGPLQAPWAHVLESMKQNGTGTGEQATRSVEQLMAQAQTAMRDGRASGLRAAQAMIDSYSALVSGVLIGMSEGLQQQSETASSSNASGARSKRK